ncbi:hypothetical protein [Cupriavidus necator]|uniref:hypothetical protein n=1 Tax=Cupriavidus necator TaxID=106590 RepID=UPI0027833D7A|nr:hypothetical protein [Cupriavidus necator]MDQ0140962.1 hypothetical protein [Cupriavidus necator]
MSEFTSTLPFQKQAELWGQTYEILVKRGVLACLLERKLLSRGHPALQPWREVRLTKVSGALAKHLDVIDENARELIKAAVDHIALTAYGVGYTAMREYLKQIGKPVTNGKLKVRALWCPLTLPGESTAAPEARQASREQLHAELGLPGPVDPALSDKGQPANADFMLWLSGTHREDYLLVQEYSFDMPGDMGDFRHQQAHLDELLRHRRLVDSRSVFARVAAEIDGETFDISEDIRQHLTALTSENKPLYKLCQACGYGESTADVLAHAGLKEKPIIVRALAITPNGLESLAARFDNAMIKEPRRRLMEQMGEAYRRAPKLADGDNDGLTQKVGAVFNSLSRKLPRKLQDGMKGLRKIPTPGEDYLFEFEEEVPSFANPMQLFAMDDALSLVEEAPAINEYFGGSARAEIGAKMRNVAGTRGHISLRDMHASAIVAGMEQAKAGELNVVALEGNPGIGKTTAVRRYLSAKPEGYLFLYVSPRVVINRDVTESLARNDGKPTGILTVTSNAQLNAAAKRFHAEKVDAGLAEPKLVEGAVVADGVSDLVAPEGSTILVLSPEEETAIDTHFAGESYRKTTLSESEDQVLDARRMGVLAGVSQMARELLTLNGHVNRVVITAALQGFRERSGGKTTMDALSNLFENKAESTAGIAERRLFSQRIPNVVVMVDELAGDGAGAPFVDAVARWLNNEFLDCFENEVSPFTVTLVVSDASLGNEVVLDRYLNAGKRTPDKVLISRSRGEQPFAVAVTPVRIGGGTRRTYHVMTNSFPASELHIRYQAKLTAVRLEESPTGLPETPRQAIRRVAEDALMQTAVNEICSALGKGAVQVIYFAQDKNFLSDLRRRLSEEKCHGLSSDTVEVLDSSVPGWKRAELVKPERRDSIRAFLMTSSGARGVSFPKTDWIIANMPRFNVEAALMEIAQLIYRGRGMYVDEDGASVSGDFARRHLVMLTEDFVISDEEIDQRQWLRQSLDLMTLLVMLRATIFTRITGAAGLRQKLALVPVGAVGVEELVSLMSQNVSKFIREAEVFQRRASDRSLIGLAKNAQANVNNLFSRTRLQANSQRDRDGRTMVKLAEMQGLRDIAIAGVAPLLVEHEGKSIPEHVYFSGPVVMEDWESFAKQEAFTFEGHETQIAQCSKELLGQLYRIDQDHRFPSSLRQPALNLFRLIRREKEGAANEFNTLKDLRSPNTWVAVPTGYAQFLYNGNSMEGRRFVADEPELWRDALAKSLGATSAVMPPIPHFESFPWAASVGRVNPLKLDLVFDDRYFMASNELNLLNTLLLEAAASEEFT